MSKILLTGATGFLGSHLLKSLLQHGYQVAIVKRSISDCSKILECLAGCAAYDIDICTFEEVFRDVSYDCVIHCATAYGRSGEGVSAVLESNLLFPVKLLETAIRHQVRYFFNADSFFTKQLPDRLIKEKPIYLSEYTVSKYQFQEWGHLRALEGMINFISLQIEHMYGEDDSKLKFIPSIMRQLKAEVHTIALTDGMQIRDFIHVDDVVGAFCSILENLNHFCGYAAVEVGTGTSSTVKELVEMLKQMLGAKTQLNFGQLVRSEAEIVYSTADVGILKSFGWRPKYENIYQYFSNRDNLDKWVN